MTTNRDKGWAGETNTKRWPKARLEGKQGPWSFCRRIFVSVLLMDQQGTSWAFSVRNNIIKPVSSETCSGCTVGMTGLAQGCNQPELFQFELHSELSQGRGDRERSCWGILDTKTPQDRMVNWVKCKEYRYSGCLHFQVGVILTEMRTAQEAQIWGGNDQKIH